MDQVQTELPEQKMLLAGQQHCWVFSP